MDKDLTGGATPEYDLIVIGSGPGGYVAAIKAAQLGMKTAIIEKEQLGGTCTNRGCIPTKAMLHSANLYDSFKKSSKYGINAAGITVNYEELCAERDQVVEKLRGGIGQLLKANKVDVVFGAARICNAGDGESDVAGKGVFAGTVKVGDVQYKAGKILIATGSQPSMPPIPGIELSGVVTSDQMLKPGESIDPGESFNHGRLGQKLPESLIIIGGGVIGVEFASLYAALGSEVVIVEAMERILSTMDRDISQNLSVIFKKRGVKVFTGALVEKIGTDAGAARRLNCSFTCKGAEQRVEADTILVATGRKPYTEGLFEKKVSVLMERGRIIVDENFETNVKGIYAIGDVSSKIQLAHAASAQGIAAAEIMAGHKPFADVSNVPGCVYTSPEIATIGITEQEAKDAGIPALVGKNIMHANCKSIISGSERSFVKIVAHAESGVILGAQLMCERATDIISELSTAVTNKLTVDMLRRTIRPHPTFGEAVTEALEDFGVSSVHTVQAK